MTFISVLRVIGDVVPRPHRPADHPAHRHPRPAGFDRRRLPAGRAAARHLVADDVPRRGGDRACSSACWSLVALRDAPAGTVAAGGRRHGGDAPRLADTWREPGTRIGLYTHLVTQFSGTVFALLWGYPFLVVGEGLLARDGGRRCSPCWWSSAWAWARCWAGCAGGGRCAGRCWSSRSSGATATVWTVVLLWPGRAPLWLLVRARRRAGHQRPGLDDRLRLRPHRNPAERQGSASGVVNVGGFVASLLTILAVGAVLDLLTPGALDRLQARRVPGGVLRPVRVLGDRPGRRDPAPPAAARAAGPRRRRPRAAVRGRGRPAARRFGLPLTSRRAGRSGGVRSS